MSPAVYYMASLFYNGTYVPKETIIMTDLRIWDQKNLNTITYRDGTVIPEVKAGWTTLKTGAWRFYDEISENGRVYGRLYNWYAMMGIATEESNPPTPEEIANRKNIAPEGWSVASYSDWLTLSATLGGNSISGGKLKESGTIHWIAGNTGTNTSTFTALPGGYKKSSEISRWNPYSSFKNIGKGGYWWSKDAPGYNNFVMSASLNTLSNTNSGITPNGGRSIRLIKDNSVIPRFNTTYPTAIGTTSITGTGGYIPTDYSGTITERGIVYATTINPTTANTKIISGSGTGSYTINITGLLVGRTYYIRAYVLISGVITYANNVGVTTSDGLAQVVTDDISEIWVTTATCGGEVFDDGGFSVTSRGVCWNTEGNPTISNSKTSNGTGVGVFISEMTGLSPNVTYKVRAYATNSVTTTYGDETTFTTLAAPIINTIFGYTTYHAHSLRRLSNNYTLKCLRVRRTTLTPSVTTTVVNVYFNLNNTIGLDSAITYISGTYTNAETLGEFAASVIDGFQNPDDVNVNQDIFVQTWYDQSGNNKNVTQSTSTSQPKIVSGGNLEVINSDATMRFSGIQTLSVDDSTIPYSNSSFYALGSATSTVTNTIYSLGYLNSDARLFLPQRNGIAYNNSTTFTFDWPQTIPFTANTPRLYELVCGNSTASAYSNGLQLSPLTVPSLLVNSTRIRIGFAGFTPTYYLTGTVQEVIAFTGTPDREAIESNINTYYNVW